MAGIAGVENEEDDIGVEGAAGEEEADLVSDTPFAGGNIQNVDGFVDDGGETDGETRGEDERLIDVCRSIGHGVADEEDSFMVSGARQEEFVGAHAEMIDVVACKETVDVLIRSGEIGARRIRRIEERRAETQDEAEQYFHENDEDGEGNESPANPATAAGGDWFFRGQRGFGFSVGHGIILGLFGVHCNM